MGDEGGNALTCIICIIGSFEMRGADLPAKESYLSYLIGMKASSFQLHRRLYMLWLCPKWSPHAVYTPRIQTRHALISRIGKMQEKRAVGQRSNLKFGLLEIVNKYQIACLVKNFLERIQNYVGCPKHVWYKLLKLAQKPWASSPKEVKVH